MAGIIQKNPPITKQTKKVCGIISAVGAIVMVLCIIIFFNLQSTIKKTGKQIKFTESKIEQTNIEIKKIEQLNNTTKFEKEILKLKLLARDQINKELVPWYEVLSDITKIVPRNVKLTEINKQQTRGRTNNTGMEIKGQMNYADKHALTTVSYMVLNINENLPDTTLMKNASVGNFQYNEAMNIYNFSIQSDLKNKPERHPHNITLNEKMIIIEDYSKE